MENKQKEYYNKVYKDRDSRVFSTNDIYLINFLNSLDIKDRVILEIGCGDGYLTNFLLEQNPSKVHAVDISDVAINSMKEKFKEYCENGLLILENTDLADYLKRDNQKFDLIIGSGILHHVDKKVWSNFFGNAYKSLNRDGLLVFAPEPNVNGILFWFWKLASFFYNKLYKISYDDDVERGTFDMKPIKIEKSLKNAGFKKVEILPFKVIPEFNAKIFHIFNKYLASKKSLGKFSTYIAIKALKGVERKI